MQLVESCFKNILSFSPLMYCGLVSSESRRGVNRINALKKNSNRINFHVGIQMLNLVAIRRFFTFLDSCIVNYEP